MFLLQRYRRFAFAWALLFLQLLVVSDHLHAASENQQTSPHLKLLVLGDSLSAGYGLKQQEGWVSLLQNIWLDENRKVEVINAATSGETSDGGLARLPRLLDQHAPTHVHLWQWHGSVHIDRENAVVFAEFWSKLEDLNI